MQSEKPDGLADLNCATASAIELAPRNRACASPLPIRGMSPAKMLGAATRNKGPRAAKTRPT